MSRHAQHSYQGRRGITRVELVVTVICIGMLIVLALTIVAPSRPRMSAKRLKDATQIRAIHQAWRVFARDFDGHMPIPGLIDRLPFNDVEEPGRGEEDTAQNTTANLYSVTVMLNYITPELCVGPTESNPRVKELDINMYNYQSYAPANGVFWDSAFKADLQNVSHASYAHMPLIESWKKHWRESMKLDASWPIIGNRGPLNGVHDPASYTNSLHKPFDQWSGNICFADGHVEFFVGLRSAKTESGGTIDTQGLFRLEAADDLDGMLTFTKAMTPQGPVMQHD